MPHQLVRGVVVVACAGFACAAHAQLSFSDHTERSGIEAVYSGPFMLGAGAAGDFDGDGDQDLFIAGGGAGDQLLINDGTGSFTDESAAWGITRVHTSGGVAVGDFNNDGHLDIFVASQSTQGHSLYRNTGNRSFTDIAVAAGVSQTTSNEPDGFGASFGDYDLDGDLDLAVAGWGRFNFANRVFRNNGDETFTIVSAYDSPKTPVLFTGRVYGFSPRFHDMDNDLYPELLWVADYGSTAYFKNNRDGSFTEITDAAGVGVERNGMGQAVGDLNNDGLPDWYVTSIQANNSGNALYLNQGDHQYTESAQQAGVRDGYWGWGTVAVDFDHDGDLDLAETNGWSGWDSPSMILLNDGDATAFTEVAASIGLDHAEQGRGLINLDIENDGDQDLLFLASGGNPARMFCNDLVKADSSWLRVLLDTSNHPRLAPNGIHARVTITIGDQTLHRWIDSGSSYISQSELSAHFGWSGHDQIGEVRVRWTNGTETVLESPGSNQTITVAACAADDNLDGSVDSADVYSYIARFMKQERAADLAAPLGTLNFFDLGEFLRLFSRGCY